MTYFIDEVHEKNFKHLTTLVFPHSEKDNEYKAVSYILSLPEIYVSCINDPLLHEYPFLWTTEYNYNENLIHDEEFGDYYEVDLNIEKDSDGNEVNSKDFSTLSHGYKLMIYLGQNLFNSSNDLFNLTRSFGTWDKKMIKVFYQALEIRFGRV